ncbi:hypothetical protein [Dysgonomonas massiliensis]|uniref:hypothetical protein n=1 Tax=Dysgonomonas massiliensis TaxID=2040292 RepID=UPI000C794735|nr:hypothetical protein [Dysgonomonas massiliensis]
MTNYLYEDKRILTLLYEKGKLDIYKIHQEELFSPAQIMRSVRNFISLGYIRKEDLIIKPTKEGKLWIKENLPKILMERSDKIFTKIPEDMLIEEDQKIHINEPYIPEKIFCY